MSVYGKSAINHIKGSLFNLHLEAIWSYIKMITLLQFYKFWSFQLYNILFDQDIKTYTISDIPELFDYLVDEVKNSSVRQAAILAGRVALNFFRKASSLRGRGEYIWPEEVKPGDRRIIFEPDAVKFVAAEAEKALINLSFYRSAKALLVKVGLNLNDSITIAIPKIPLESCK